MLADMALVQGVNQTNMHEKRGSRGSISSVTVHPFTLVFGACVVWVVSWLVNSNSLYDVSPILVSDSPLMKDSSCTYESKSRDEEEEEEEIKSYEETYLQLPFTPVDDETLPVHAYEKFDHPFPCFSGDKGLMDQSPTDRGILFQRPHKVGRYVFLLLFSSS